MPTWPPRSITSAGCWAPGASRPPGPVTPACWPGSRVSGRSAWSALPAELAGLRPRPQDTVGYATRIALRELGRRAEFLAAQIDYLDTLLRPSVVALVLGHRPVRLRVGRREERTAGSRSVIRCELALRAGQDLPRRTKSVSRIFAGNGIESGCHEWRSILRHGDGFGAAGAERPVSREISEKRRPYDNRGFIEAHLNGKVA
jgi:hypothetical protein